MSAPAPGPSRVIAVVGLAREARIAAGPGVRTIIGGGAAARLAADLERAVGEGAKGIISFGIAGGLDPALAPGACIIGSAVSLGAARWTTHAAWTAKLEAALPGAILAEVAGSDHPLASAKTKRMLRVASGAAAVDMESHVAGRTAAAHGLPFAILRVVCDPASRGLPSAALKGMRSDGTTDIAAVLAALIRAPWQLMDLIRLAGDANMAFAGLGRCRHALGPLAGFPFAPQ